MGKTRDLFKKTGDAQGTFYKRMGMIKYRNHRDLTEAEGLRGSSKEYTENYTKKVLMIWITMMM